MGEWHKYTPPDPGHPCTNCQMGWGSQSHKVINGENYFKVDSCDETCGQLKEYRESREHFIGDNIRDAIRSIRS